MRPWALFVTTVVLGTIALACGAQPPAASPDDAQALAALSESPPAQKAPTNAEVQAPETVSEAPAVAANDQPAETTTAASTRDTSPRKIDRATGDLAKDFELVMFDGSTFRLSDHRGEVVVLNFWASWCGPCRWEMPDFENIWQEYEGQGVVFVGIAMSDTEEAAREFAGKTGVSYLLGLDGTGDIVKDYRVFSLPTTYLIDKEGNEARKFNLANKAVLRLFLKGQLDGG